MEQYVKMIFGISVHEVFHAIGHFKDKILMMIFTPLPPEINSTEINKICPICASSLRVITWCVKCADI